ncbi:hypothetical protein UPYG_G00022160 [Umbra pygmaea]|uniref:Uncharacterized protein n=1 Tax=Umbra pygmaea TaxID=75934 RepID=A0ABD0Y890_UMBPY
MDFSRKTLTNENITNENTSKRRRAAQKLICSPPMRILKDTSNEIPLGRQILRTPPLSELKRHFVRSETHINELPCNTDAILQPNEDTNMQTKGVKRTKASPVKEHLSPVLNVTMDLYQMEPVESEMLQRSRVNSSTICSASMLEEDPYSLIRGMEGYEVTLEDLAFIKAAKQKKQLNNLQSELVELLKQLENKIKISREKFQAELNQILSCKSVGGLLLSSLSSLRSSEVESLDKKSLLAQKKTAYVQQAVLKEQAKLVELEDRVAKALRLREKEEQRPQEIENQYKHILKIEANVNRVKMELSELSSQLTRALDVGNESFLTTQRKFNNLEVFKAIENEGDVISQEASQVDKGQAKARNKKRKYAKTSTQVVSLVQIKVENVATTIGAADEVTIRRSSRIAKKKSSETVPVLGNMCPVKTILHGKKVKIF